MVEIDKSETQFIEDINTSNNSSNESPNNDFSDLNETKLLRKMDLHILPVISVLYLLAYLDRGNIGNAKIEGLPESLNLSSSEYNICLTVFFLTYASFEVPSNMLLKKIGKQSVFLPTIMLCWGIVMVCMGVVQNYAGLLITRLLLGLFEASLYPSIVFCLTQYYCKREMQFRQAILHGSASAAGRFSGILAFAIAKMNGVGGYEGWRWIFILEGLLTVIVAISAYFLLYDYPDTAKFLTEREREFIIWRLKNDSNPSKNLNDLDSFSSREKPDFQKFSEADDLSLKKSLVAALKSYEVYLYVLTYYGVIVPTYGFALFLPSVVKELGYTSSTAQLMTVPIYVTASIVSIIVAYYSDKTGLRSPFIVGSLFLVMLGYIFALVGEEIGYPNLIYGGVYIAGIGVYSAFPGAVSWLVNNLANSRKRAIGLALQLGIGNFGGAFASNFYIPGKYSMGHGLEIGFSSMGIIVTGIIVLYNQRCNRKRQRDLANGKYDEI
ncbi:hypothetical protein WICANDRAFT_105447 [Wickerhamomyces anomalus NRRL Y-366-8]|uniref:Major facilitator superfamily (MFS) profile domain-containing protein n=1 Tax=Wickerhamomyces anomalus (strain ATCC 58044 / CBS 1984 / NCYC 433 / NRRL Y-366-8) TaxID=683960 RepID=A0A1E3P0W3_WICAA|nr:uncharacterized protein WICANDRAFT_105447 [Wickerhamomyces anomalus NRRL Y-366-8]ODQ58562.1 hypothetical protein WICANDRAFT_105447 [Wickerhamomyces anomalus NRRL Y-366-8]